MRTLALAFLLLAPTIALASPITPAIDDGPGPFCYFSHPSTVIGVPDSAEGTQVTAEGWLWTGSAQLVLFTGPELTPLRQRIQALQNGSLPVVSHVTRQGDITYEITMFAATLDGRWDSPLVNFIRARVSNCGWRARTATFATAVRAEGPYCCERLRQPVNVLAARYQLIRSCAVRDDRVIYTFPATPAPRLLALPGLEGSGPVTGLAGHVTRDTPVCMARYDLSLKPGASRSLDFTMPYTPMPLAQEARVRALLAAGFDDRLQRTAAWWRRYLASGTQIRLPEGKVVDTYRASIMYDAIAREKTDGQPIVTVNRLQYHYFWVRDGAYIINAFDLTGRHRWAEEGLTYYLKQQQPDGIMYQPPQYDGWGQTLWAFGSHWRLTGDDAWARRVYPALARHARGVFAQIARDPLGVVTAAPPYDAEAIDGHYTGHNFWLLIGLRDLIAMARALMESHDVDEFTTWHDAYLARFTKALDAATAPTHGYIPPGLDGETGCDWDNLIALYPRGGVPARGAMDIHDPRVGVTLHTVRKAKGAEGLLTYGPGLRVGTLHHYDTMKATEDLVTLNRQREALADFYAVLAHTSSTHGGFEGGIAPWDNRDPGGNFPPHGWCAAEYVGLLRNMLLREWEGDLHLFSVLSPAWLKPGNTISVRRAPTDFGNVSMTAEVCADGMTLRLRSAWRTAPRTIVVHIPWFLGGGSATADGRTVAVERPPYGEGTQVTLPPDARLVTLKWRPGLLPDLSYAATVAGWKRENRRHFDAFVREGGQSEPLWPEGPLAITEAARNERWADFETQHGIAVGCPATASSFLPGLAPEAAVDGSLDRAVYWAATPAPQWWQVDLGRPRRIDRVHAVTYWEDGGARTYQYRVLASTDGTGWQTVADLSANHEPAIPAGQTHVFAPTLARYVRLEMLRNSANEGVHLVEVEVFPAVEAPVAEAPARSTVAWSAEGQSGARATDMDWRSVSAQRIVLQGRKIERSGDRVRLVFRGGRNAPISIGAGSIAATAPGRPTDIIASTRVPLTFRGASVAELPAGGTAASDWVSFPLRAGRDHSVSFAVLRTGGTMLWPDGKTVRTESAAPGAALKASWLALTRIDSYNLYFLERVEVPQ